DKAPGTYALGALPGVRRHDDLRPLARRDVGAEPVDRALQPILADAEIEGRTAVPVPDLDRIDPVPVGALAGGQQVVDRRHGSTPAGRIAVAVGLAEVAAFWVRLEAELLDDLGCVEHQSFGSVSTMEGRSA